MRYCKHCKTKPIAKRGKKYCSLECYREHKSEQADKKASLDVNKQINEFLGM